MRFLLLLGTLLLGACSGASNSPPLTSFGAVDLQRYQGTWYEQARKPMYFQRHCLASEANYQLDDSGVVAVRNRCVTDDGTWQEVQGTAQQQSERTDQLWVRFDNWFSNLFPKLTRSHYWVLYLDDDYSQVLVGEPTRKYLWLMSREQNLPEPARAALLKRAQTLGYDVSDLIWRDAKH